jgi:cytochrome c-type biogenesis protein CcmE
MTRKQRRFTFIIGIGAVLALALVLILTALSEKIIYFYDPSDINLEHKAKAGQKIRIGGLVEEDSVKRGEAGLVQFNVTDTQEKLQVRYIGILPDLFREGQGVVVEGALDEQGIFIASTVLAKHDENYISKEVAESLKEKGVWQGENE